MALAQRYWRTSPGSTLVCKEVQATAGDLIIVGFTYDLATATATCTDNAAGGTNAYTQYLTGGNFFTNALISIHLFYCIAKATENLTVTCAATGVSATQFPQVHVHIVSGALQNVATVLDIAAFDTGEGASGTTHTSAAITTTVADTYIFTLWAEDMIASSLTDDNQAFILDYNMNGSTIGSTFHKIVSATGTYSQNATSTATAFYGNVIAAFKMATALVPPVITSFTATPSNSNSGSSVTLAWVTTGATTLSIDQGIGTVTGDSNSTAVSPTVNTLYTLTATNADGSTLASAQVRIIAAAFQADTFQNNAFQVTGGVIYNATYMMALF